MIPDLSYLPILDRWGAWIALTVVLLAVFAAAEIVLRWRRR
jgi:hypothetical protein